MATGQEQDKDESLPRKVENFLYAYDLVFETPEFEELRAALEALRGKPDQ